MNWALIQARPRRVTDGCKEREQQHEPARLEARSRSSGELLGRKDEANRGADCTMFSSTVNLYL